MRLQCRFLCIMESPPPIRRGPPKTNPGLLELIRNKRERHWKPSIEELKQGFRGWHQRGYLPHFDAPGVTQFITFQLEDSFPVTCKAGWESILNEPEHNVKRRKLEAWLDRGHGRCGLFRQDLAKLVETILLADNGCDYRMMAWALMPNHVHLVVEVWDRPLSKLIGGWKGKSARSANDLLGRSGKFWQDDYYDTLIRDQAHFKQAVSYTEQNPVKVKLAKTAREWPWGSAKWRDNFERLPREKSE